MPTVLERMTGERGERAKTFVATIALTALAAIFAAGGPGYWPAPTEAPSVAKLIRVERAVLRQRPPKRDVYGNYTPTPALIRIPDRAARVEDYFAAMDYRLTRVREGGAKVPRVYLAALPSGMKKLAPTARRKALFIRAMLPLVLKANEEVLATRRRIETLRATLARHGKLSDRDRKWLLDVVERYRADPVQSLAALNFERLLTRVDIVPPSLAITQSILESGWGTSRFARNGNALFGQRTWDTDTPGLKPRKADGFKVRAFETLGESVRAYIHNLNTTKAYAALRAQRAEMRRNGSHIDGYHLAGALQSYSEEGAKYVRKLRDLMAHNGLRAFDRSALRPSILAQRVIPDEEVSKIRVALDLDR